MPVRRPLTRRDVDVRLGYTGLGIGALSFVLVLVASFVVIEVGPRVDLPDVLARQSVVRYPALESVPVSDRDDRPSGNPATAERARPDRPAGDAGTVSPEPDEAGGPDDGDGVVDGGGKGDGGNGDGGNGDGGNGDGGGTPGDPDDAVADGPVSQAVDPVVTGLTDALDAATGGATSPVTTPVVGLTDDVSDLGDALLGRP
ncbi:MAG: hypothetical protein Q8O61_04060 [Nocardioides sp.]|nr:hypothetical protein [Nocardioides sp.]